MYKNILLAIDIDDEENTNSNWSKCLETALEFSEAFDSTLHILNVIPSGAMSVINNFFKITGESSEEIRERLIDETKKKLRKFVDEHVPSDFKKYRCIVGVGSVYACIIDTSNQIECDLIIISAHKKEVKDYLLGPNSAKVVRHASTSVLVVRD